MPSFVTSTACIQTLTNQRLINERMKMQAQDILTFWFEEITPAQHWKKDPDFDQLIAHRFGALLTSAARCELFSWRSTPAGRLAEIIVLDHFSRNIYREQANSFAQDPLALALAQEAINCGADLALPPAQRVFLYMPFMHSESVLIQEVAVDLFQKLGVTGNFEFAMKHKKIIDQFGRYPHRNAILGRVSTEAEIAFLKLPGSGF